MFVLVSRTKVLALGLALAGAGAAQAQGREGRPAVFQKLIDCRALRDDAARLTCFDTQLQAMEQAETRREVVVVDRAEVKKARRSLFGFSLPKLTLFGDREGDPQKEEFTRIETKITAARQLGDGRWAITIEDGARWIQTDSRPLASDPRPGQSISIRKAALGSFLANVNGQTAIRMKRDQ